MVNHNILQRAKWNNIDLHIIIFFKLKSIIYHSD